MEGLILRFHQFLVGNHFDEQLDLDYKQNKIKGGVLPSESMHSCLLEIKPQIICIIQTNIVFKLDHIHIIYSIVVNFCFLLRLFFQMNFRQIFTHL